MPALEFTAADAKLKELEEILISNQRISDRLKRIDERLGVMSGILSGEVPCQEPTAVDHPSQPGLIGQLKATQTTLFQHNDSIEEWITCMERVI